MRSNAKDVEAAALRDIFYLGKPVQAAVCALMEAKLSLAHEEMESAHTQDQLFRAQGRAQQAREILSQLTRSSANSSEIL